MLDGRERGSATLRINRLKHKDAGGDADAYMGRFCPNAAHVFCFPILYHVPFGRLYQIFAELRRLEGLTYAPRNSVSWVNILREFAPHGTSNGVL
jgi:hypothetical protein